MRIHAIFNGKHPIIPAVEDLDVETGVQLAQAAHLSVLAGHETLFERGELDEHVEVDEIEIRCEALGHTTIVRPLQGEGVRLVGPPHPVEVEDSCELALAGVSEGRRLLLARLA